MKRIRGKQDEIAFELVAREKQLLLQLLKRYPCVPPAHHRLSQQTTLPNAEANQKLLDEALAEQRAENRRQLALLLKDPKRLRDTPHGCRLSLRPSDFEWLLQVLNDIRVGSWIAIGCPDERLHELEPTPQTLPHLWAMELAGHFQFHLLKGMSGGT